jgi:hypothetical protein
MDSDKNVGLNIKLEDRTVLEDAIEVDGWQIGYIKSDSGDLSSFIKNEHLEEYKQKMDWFYSELVELNNVSHFMQKIIEFPFVLFRPNKQNNYLFFNTIMSSFHQTAIFSISRLVTDGRDTYSLFHFKNDVFRWATDQGKEMLKEQLKTVETQEIQQMAREKTRELRDSVYAHTLITSIDSEKTIYYAGLKDFKELHEKLQTIFDALSFETQTVRQLKDIIGDLDLEQAGIEEILDNIAKTSELFNLPESDMQEWLNIKRKLTDEQIQKFNQYRHKFNLPEV